MEFRILGPLEVIGAAAVDLTGPRERALLARLLLSANQVVSSERLIEDVWEDAPPDNALRALPVYISRLRKALRGAGLDVILTSAPGYVIHLAPGDLDAARFEAMVATGRDQAAAGDTERAATTLSEALALWRGPVLADIADASFARAEAVRLEEARLSAMEDRIDADLALGRHGGLMAELAALVAAHPLRERLWGQHMLALYRAGRQADALRAYQELRGILVEELGVDPTAALARLETAILRHDEELEWKPVGPPLPTTKPPEALSVPLPHFLTEVGRIFVGRDDELARLEQLWKESVAGERRVALLAGEPGVGKTRLAAELARLVHEEGAIVLAGRCDEDLRVPYQPFVEALRHFADHIPSEHLRPRLGRHGGELARLVPELDEQAPDLLRPLRSDPETETYRLFDAVTAWLAAASQDAPLLFILDDLQWAAKPTLLLLRHVVRSAEAMRLFVLCTYRDSELVHDHPLIQVIADLRRQGGAERLALSGLDDMAVAAFVEQAAGRALDEDGLALVHAIYAETEGNPFFVREVLRHLTETGAVERRKEGWATRLPVEDLGIPEGVRDVIGRRLSHLSRDANRVLRIAAVMGAEFDLGLLRTAEDLDDEDLVSALEEATSARLVIEVAGTAPGYRFAHALVRDTIYEGLSAARRTTLHRRVAEAIETVHGGRLDDQLPALAYHWARAAAPAPETGRAIDYAARAGDRALAQLAHDEAATYYRQALELLDVGHGSDGARRVELLISLGEAQRRAGDPAYRDTLLNAAHLAQELRDAVRLARAALANTRGFSIGGEVDADRAEILEAALEALGDSEPGLRARLLITLANEVEFSSDRERRHRLTTEALDVARQLGDPEVLGYVLATGYFPSLGLLDVHDVEENVAELAAVSEQVGDPAMRWWAAVWQSTTAALKGDLSAALRHADAAARLAEELRRPFTHFGVAWLRAGLFTIAGDPDTAEALAGHAFELAQAAGFPDAFRLYGTQLFWVRYDQGRLDELLDILTRAVRREGVIPLTRVTFCLTLCELDRPEEARPYFRELAADGFSPPFGYQWRYAMALLSEICARLGDLEAAAVLLGRLVPHHAMLAAFPGAAAGPVAHYLGLLASTLERYDEAETHFQQAASIAERIGAPAWLARTRLEWARMLLARRQPGDAQRASDLLDQTVVTASKLGLGNVERRAVELLVSG